MKINVLTNLMKSWDSELRPGRPTIVDDEVTTAVSPRREIYEQFRREARTIRIGRAFGNFLFCSVVFLGIAIPSILAYGFLNNHVFVDVTPVASVEVEEEPGSEDDNNEVLWLAGGVFLFWWLIRTDD